MGQRDRSDQLNRRRAHDGVREGGSETAQRRTARGCPGEADPGFALRLLARTLITNLIDNAIRYNHRGGIVEAATVAHAARNASIQTLPRPSWRGR